MANTLLGKLQIDISDVTKSLQQVNTALLGIGKGVNVDISGITKTITAEMDKLSKTVDNINEKLRNLGSGQSGGKKGGKSDEQKAVDELIKKYTELYNIKKQLTTGVGDAESKYLRNRATAIMSEINDTRRYTEE